jgi:glycosyltransferase involved in cell wall biosynthesis
MLIAKEARIRTEIRLLPLKRIKVLHFSACPDGGIKRHVLDLVEGMPRDEFDFQGAFIDPARCAVLGVDPQDTYSVHFERLGLSCYLLDFPRHLSPWKDLKTLLQLLRILRTERPDILHCHSSKAGIVGRAAGLLYPRCKVLYSPHCMYFAWQTGLRRRLSLALEKLFARVGTMIAVSASEESELREHFPGSAVLKVNNGIGRKHTESHVSSPLSVRQEFGIPDNAFIVLSITRLERVKDVPTLVRGFAKLPHDPDRPVHLVIAGDGIQRTAVEEIASDLGVTERLHLVGWRSDVQRLLQACHCVVLTSLSEGLPYALLESAVIGRPIIATRVRGSRDVVLDQQTGFLIEPGDAAALAERLHRLISDPDLCHRLGESARKFVAADFDVDRMCEAYGHIYREHVQ